MAEKSTNHRAHGDFEITRKGEIFLIRFRGEWNLEGAKAFFDAYKKVVESSGLGKFGVISDMRGFGGGTPEAVDSFEAITRWAIKRGQVARAVLLYTDYEEFIVQQIDRKGRSMPSQSFDSEVEAVDWLVGHGLSAGLPPGSP